MTAAPAPADRYADPYHGLDGRTDEDTVAIATVLPRTGARLDYR